MSYLSSLFVRPASPFAPPSTLYLLLFHPLTTLISFLHHILLTLRGVPYRPPPSAIPINVVCISDTHSQIPPSALPKGDLLIHAGDLSKTGTLSDIQRSIDWLKTLQKPWYGSSDGYRYIVVIAGNHDSYFDPRSRSAHDKRNEKTRNLDWGKIIYLEHSSVTLPFPGDRKLKVYGAPQIPKCGGKDFAFQYARSHDAWTDTLPEDIDVLVTHNPPKWHLDIPENGGLGDEHELKECWRIKPTLHVCGHIHSGHGKEYLWWDEAQRQMEDFRRAAWRSYPELQSRSIAAWLNEVLSVRLWMMAVKVVWLDCKGLIWTWFWGASRNGSIFVNAALTYQTTEELLNPPQTVVL